MWYKIIAPCGNTGITEDYLCLNAADSAIFKMFVSDVCIDSNHNDWMRSNQPWTSTISCTHAS